MRVKKLLNVNKVQKNPQTQVLTLYKHRHSQFELHYGKHAYTLSKPGCVLHYGRYAYTM